MPSRSRSGSTSSTASRSSAGTAGHGEGPTGMRVWEGTQRVGGAPKGALNGHLVRWAPSESWMGGPRLPGGHPGYPEWAPSVPQIGASVGWASWESWMGGPRAPGGHPKVPPMGTQSGGQPRHPKWAPKASQVGTRHIPNMNLDHVGTPKIQDPRHPVYSMQEPQDPRWALKAP